MTAASNAPLLRRPFPITLILASFFALTVPLTIARFIPPTDLPTVVLYLFTAQAVGLGVSHFVITGAIYLRHENLAFFSSTTGRKLVYFGVPILIFTAFGLIEATGFTAAYPAAAATFFATIRLFDFTHVGRQGFGVLQLVRGSYGAVLPGWTRRAENTLFVGLALLQMATFLYGKRFDPSQPVLVYGSIAAGGLFVVIASQYVRGLFDPVRRKGLWIPFVYLVLQAFSSSLAVYATTLYVVALTMHYVEYHVLMAPRCFAGDLDVRYRVDRVMHWFTRNKWAFYVGIVGLAFFIKRGTAMIEPFVRGLPAEFPLIFFLNVFAGINLFHYFVDAFIWKFSNPYYQRTALPLYRGGSPPGSKQ